MTDGADGRRELLTRVRERLAGDAADPTPQVMADAIRTESRGMLGDTDLLEALRFLQTELVGAGLLEDVLAEPDVADVLVVGPRQVWVDRGAGLRLTDIVFDDDAAVRRLAVRLAAGAGRRLDDAAPWVDGQLRAVGRRGYSVRLHAVIPPISVDGTCLSLRVLRPATLDFAALVARDAIAPDIVGLVDGIVAARLAFLVVGGTGAGKTSLLSGLLGRVDPAERILCVEDAVELAPTHPHVVRLVARTANVEGVGAVGVRDLVRQALRMRPDRIVVGEVRGAEVVDLLTALNTGHEGCAGTLHANSIEEVPARIEALAALGGMDRPAVHSQLAAAVDVVVAVARGADGSRGISQIGLLDRGPDGWVRTRCVWDRTDGFTAAADELRLLMSGRIRDDVTGHRG
ncbi:TadA family conjugal transfer-associated ATPase [Williamsia deligens]|uniref:TadA family conjugal transfer-associated ATPase n=1 Tax=Williamsia deligens TaxID=321325 RepID=A0ABW3G8L3_9NOCA|nr:TadA family conjugal transfer-associated ATPase [Williamsia deligens]MCP2193270.1 pilus assembly protein CpaF [Williamsia deligens]